MAKHTYTWTDAEPRERLAEIMAKAKPGNSYSVEWLGNTASGQLSMVSFTRDFDNPWTVTFYGYGDKSLLTVELHQITAFSLATDEPDEPWWGECMFVMDDDGEAWTSGTDGWRCTEAENEPNATGLEVNYGPITPLVTADGRHYVPRDVRKRVAEKLEDELDLDCARAAELLDILDAEFGIDGEPR